jgi:predicted GNAT family acetyltransferase
VIDRDPAYASVLATNLDQTLHGPGLATHWFLIQEDGREVGAAMLTEPFNLVVTPVPDAEVGANALAEAVQRAGLTPPGANGPPAEVTAFVRAWQARTGAEARVTGTDRLYELRSPPQYATVPGAARRVGEPDLTLAMDWMQRFEAEAEHGPRAENHELIVRRRLARGHLLLWHTGEGPVSMAGVSRPIAGVARIGAVFTPVAHRRRGFGSAVTVAAARQGFADGASACLLYADLANPVSNRIYQTIGFRPVGDSLCVTFTG